MFMTIWTFPKVSFVSDAMEPPGGTRGSGPSSATSATIFFSRLKIGVGRDTVAEAKDYVLEKVTGKSLEALNQAAERSSEALAVWLQDGVESCMNRFNQTED